MVSQDLSERDLWNIERSRSISNYHVIHTTEDGNTLRLNSRAMLMNSSEN